MSSLDPAILDRAKGAMLGLAIGDALGTTIEFSPRDAYNHMSDIVGGGPFKLPAGYWTDDTSMALCLAESLLYQKKFVASDMMNRFVNWRNYGINSSTGECFDIGNITTAALDRYLSQKTLVGMDSPEAAGNGSIMRLAPAVLFCLRDRKQAIDIAEQQSIPTHAAKEVLESCRLMASILYDHINSKESAITDLNLSQPKIIEIAKGSYKDKDRSAIESTGYVVHTLEAALWAVSRSDNFRDAVLLAVNLGGDSDTVGAVAGQLAGAKWGLSGIPAEWVQKTLWHEKLENMAESLVLSGLEYLPNPQPLTPQPPMA